jgi:type I restriction enzyme, R subunit
LPFNKGWNDGAGNPPNPAGLKTDYFWKETLRPASLTNIIGNYAQIVEVSDKKTGRKKREQIFPRFQQLDVVRKLLANVGQHGAGKRYLIEHSAGSGKSNSIAWLAHQLVGLKRKDQPVFESIIVVTDRRILDSQLHSTIKNFMQVGATVGHAAHSGDLRKFIQSGKKIIISTLQKFPFVLEEIGNDHRGKPFAIIIDEAHSSQGGRTSAAVSTALSASGRRGGRRNVRGQDQSDHGGEKAPAERELFRVYGDAQEQNAGAFRRTVPSEGKIKHRPFHSYTMKQAIEEGFILDVLESYTPVDRYYKLVKTVESDPEFDIKKAKKKLRRYVESNDHAIRVKAEIMVDHFHEQVIDLRKIGDEARAMVVTSGIERAIQYFHAIRNYLQERRSPYKAIVAFSGEHEYGGAKVTEASLNEFPSGDIPDKIQEHPYRFLICADKFQTGYDEPRFATADPETLRLAPCLRRPR